MSDKFSDNISNGSLVKRLVNVKRPDIAMVVLNNPPVNALSVKVIKELSDIIYDISKDDSVKFLTISGSGEHFSAGADLKERASMSEKDTLDFLDELNNCFDLLENLEIPTIAEISGATLGGGAELALCCDMIVAYKSNNVKIDAVKDFKIGFPETTLGIIPGAGGTYRIYKKMNQSLAKYWILSGKQFSLKEAYDSGFVDFVEGLDEVVSGDAAVWRMLSKKLSRTSLVAAKASMNKCYLETDRKKQRLIELEEYKKTLDSPERKEALKKYKKK